MDERRRKDCTQGEPEGHGSTIGKKGNEVHCGYKDHVKADKDIKIIVDFTVTSANVHDINEFDGLIDANDKEAWLDSACASD